jgi:predicted AAA+ superfamily ATPase
VFTLYPISFSEISGKYGTHETDRKLEEYLIYGSYPGVINMGDIANKKQELLDLSSSALYRDILEFQDIRNPQLLTRLLKMLAIQI